MTNHLSPANELPQEVQYQRQTPAEFKGTVQGIKGPYVHALMFNFRDGAPQEAVDRAVRMVRALGELPGILAWTIQESLDQRKGRTVLELGIFKNGQAFLDFRDHPEHQAFTGYVRDYADWNIVDFEGSPESPEAQALGTLGLLGAGQDNNEV